jgi:hypothetical protein
VTNVAFIIEQNQNAPVLYLQEFFIYSDSFSFVFFSFYAYSLFQFNGVLNVANEENCCCLQHYETKTSK